MEKIKKFIDCYIPTENCNFKCSYCYIPTLEGFHYNTKKIEKSPQFIRKALSKERLGGVCMINLCAGGETLLYENIVDIAEELTKEGHYVMVVTNGSIPERFDKMAKFSEECKKHLFIKFSYHFLELKRLNLIDVFFDNVNKMKKNNISVTVEITANDEYIPYIDEMKKVCLEKAGAIPHITVARVENGDYPIMTNQSKEDYIKTWSTFDSELFDFKISVFNEKRKEFCYAGAWSYLLNLESGYLSQCYRGKTLQNIYEDIEKPFVELPIGNHCPEPHCFNSHAFLAFGDIPELKAPTFAIERDRTCQDGSTWLEKDMSEFMKTKLFDSNKEYSDKEKKKYNKIISKYFKIVKLKEKVKKILRR